MSDCNAILQRLERENRHLKLLIAIMLALVTAVTTMAQLPGAPARIEAREFVLVNENGRARAVLGIAQESPTLSFIDPQIGELGVFIGMLPDGPVLGLRQRDGTFRQYPVEAFVAPR
jgi:hypothetical protein